MDSHQVDELKQTDGRASSDVDVPSDQSVVDMVASTSSTAADMSSERDDDANRDFDAFCEFAFPAVTEPATGVESAFYFESDHVALKDNDDYRRLLRALVTLESQRTAALNDVDELLSLQRTALRDPLQFVSRLRRGQLQAVFPPTRSPVELPAVAWQRYTDNVEAVLASLGRTGQHSTRQKHKRQLMSGIRDSSNTVDCPAASAASSRVSSTFNQPWSAQEQRLLEQLLRKYPPERFEARRFAKIAAHLPGRTTQQVTSRVQKYFIKLAKAGLPVPGRTPSLAAHGGRWFSGRLHGRHQRHGQFYYPQSTFLTSYTPPVYMTDHDDDDDDDDDDGVTGGTRPSSHMMTPPPPHHAAADDDVDEVASCLRVTDEYHELMTLTALRQSRLSTGQHCPLAGRSGQSVDGRDVLSSHIDVDYTSQSTSYLDPNYLPAL